MMIITCNKSIKIYIFIMIAGLLYFNSTPMLSSPGEGNQYNINDGPYIFLEGGKLRARWIENGNIRTDNINRDSFIKLKKRFNLLFEYDDLTGTDQLKPDYNQNYRRVDSIGVITDLHGEYNSYINLLKGSGIIDENRNWRFGTGHLVVLGDIFDRGEKVTEILWHLYGLEKQAFKAGGKMHLLLGNHEIMVLSNDTRYIHEKYRSVEKITGIKYSDLFPVNSVLGKWLRTKPVIVSINNIIFTHAGISPEMVQRQMTFRQINQLFATRIVGVPMEIVCENEELLFLVDAKGPIWYRGYFYDPDITERVIDEILQYYNKKHIIVGHTPDYEFRTLYNNKVIGADAGRGMDQAGRVLMFRDGFYYRCTASGNRIKL
jgi:hypothetical protein